MNDYPQTLEEAQKNTYGRYDKRPYKECLCAAAVFREWDSKQCDKKNGKGPAGLYCGRHAMKAEAQSEPKELVSMWEPSYDGLSVTEVKVRHSTDAYVWLYPPPSHYHDGKEKRERYFATPLEAMERALFEAEKRRDKFIEGVKEQQKLADQFTAKSAAIKAVIESGSIPERKWKAPEKEPEDVEELV